MYENVEALASIDVWIERNAVSLFLAALDEVFKILLDVELIQIEKSALYCAMLF